MLVLAMEFSRGKRAPKALLLAKDERSPRRGAASPLGGTRGQSPPESRSLKTEQKASTSDQLGVPGERRTGAGVTRQYDSLERR